jgi:superfamily I DNA and/or RNA helicase
MNHLVRIGQKMMNLAPYEKNDVLSNAYAKLGDALTHFGTAFSAKNMVELERKTGLKKEIIISLIERVQKQEEKGDKNATMGKTRRR